MYDLDLAVYILVIMMSQFVDCSHAKPVITSSQENVSFIPAFEKINQQLIRSGICGRNTFATHLKVVASAASSNNGLLCFHSIYHAEEVNVGVTLSCSSITKCPLYPVVFLCMCVCIYVCM